jgi:hypothetical protein
MYQQNDVQPITNILGQNFSFIQINNPPYSYDELLFLYNDVQLRIEFKIEYVIGGNVRFFLVNHLQGMDMIILNRKFNDIVLTICTNQFQIVSEFRQLRQSYNRVYPNLNLPI